MPERAITLGSSVVGETRDLVDVSAAQILRHDVLALCADQHVCLCVSSRRYLVELC